MTSFFFYYHPTDRLNAAGMRAVNAIKLPVCIAAAAQSLPTTYLVRGVTSSPLPAPIVQPAMWSYTLLPDPKSRL